MTVNFLEGQPEVKNILVFVVPGAWYVSWKSC